MIVDDDLSQEIALRAERCVLGAILIGAPLPSRLATSDFQSDANRAVWDALSEMTEERVPIDPLTVADHLFATGRLNRVGFRSDLSALLDSLHGSMADVLGNAEAVEEYARIVRKASKLRRFSSWAK